MKTVRKMAAMFLRDSADLVDPEPEGTSVLWWAAAMFGVSAAISFVNAKATSAYSLASLANDWINKQKGKDGALMTMSVRISAIEEKLSIPDEREKLADFAFRAPGALAITLGGNVMPPDAVWCTKSGRWVLDFGDAKAEDANAPVSADTAVKQ